MTKVAMIETGSQKVVCSNPLSSTIESETTPIEDRFRTLWCTGYYYEGLIKFQISNGPLLTSYLSQDEEKK